jgi:hypothetical protein
LFFVVAEGERTEYDYVTFLNREFGAEFRFRIDAPKRSILRNGLKPAEVVDEAVMAMATRDFDEVWALFDRDRHEGIPEAIRRAKKAGVEVALSNPAFELWLLLHFDAVPPDWRGSYNEILAKLRRVAQFAEYAKRGDKSLNEVRLQAMCDGQRDAVRRAKALVDGCAAGLCSGATGHATTCDPLKRWPSTDVWRLLTALGIAGSPSPAVTGQGAASGRPARSDRRSRTR